jgi:transcriptional regulator with XRE-family HTH domain
MRSSELKAARLKHGMSQEATAAKLGVSQPYLAMLENGKRRLTPQLVRRARRLLKLPLTVLPLPGTLETGWMLSPQNLAEDLSAVGYPGFAYLRSRRWRKNPAEVLLAALAQDNLEARLLEALPWLLVNYPDLDYDWLVSQAKQRDLQNRLGFVATLARAVAERTKSQSAARLHDLVTTLEQSRLAREDTLGKSSLNESERRWLEENRSDEAKKWNLLTDWRGEALPYYGEF